MQVHQLKCVHASKFYCRVEGGGESIAFTMRISEFRNIIDNICTYAIETVAHRHSM